MGMRAMAAFPIVCASAGALSGCIPFANTSDGGAARTVDGDISWVTTAVAAVFRDAGIPAIVTDPGSVHSGAFHVEDPWQGEYLGARVACGDNGELPLDGSLVELRVDAYIVESPVGPQPEPLPVPPVPGRSPPREAGHRSRVVMQSEGWLLQDEGGRCTLRQEFATLLLDRVAARTGRNHIAEAGEGPIGF